jgi:hypothetical protein
LSELANSPDFAVGRATLNATGVEYLEAPEASAALAAAEVVAAALGRPAASLPDDATAWLGSNRDQVSQLDAALALAAVDRVLAEESDLRELWADTGDAAWVEGLHDLRRRLRGQDPCLPIARLDVLCRRSVLRFRRAACGRSG